MQEYRKKIVAMNNVPSLLEASYVLGIHALTIVGILVAVSFLGWPSVPAAAIVLATRMRGFNNIVHESSHFHFTKDRKANDAIGKWISLFFFADFKSYRIEHSSHHAYLGDYLRDMDYKSIKSMEIHRKLNARMFLRKLLSLQFIRCYAPRPDKGDLKSLAAFLVFGSILLLLAWLDLPHTALCLLVTYFFTFPLFKWCCDLVDHGGIYLNPAPSFKSRNFIISNVLMRKLLFPRNDCYHLTHHLFPFLAVRHFDQAHHILMASEEYAEALHTWREGVKAIIGPELAVSTETQDPDAQFMATETLFSIDVHLTYEIDTLADDASDERKGS